LPREPLLPVGYGLPSVRFKYRLNAPSIRSVARAADAAQVNLGERPTALSQQCAVLYCWVLVECERVTLAALARCGDLDCDDPIFSATVFQNCSKSLTATAQKGSTLSESRAPELR
jgi:hypothetical protein